MYFDVVKAEYQADYRIHLTFEGGRSGVVDLADCINADTEFAAFSDIAYFRQFEVDSRTLVWGDGELDIAPERLYEPATGKRVVYENERKYV